MGNSIVGDFKKVELGSGSASSLAKDMIATGSIVLDKPMTVLVRHDDQRKSTIFFDFETMQPLYITSTKNVYDRGNKGDKVCVTKDRKGRALFLTTQPTKNKRLIYRAPKELTKTQSSSSSISTAPIESGSNHSTHSARVAQQFVSHKQSENDNVACAAQIDLDRAGAAVCAFLSVVVWKGSGAQFMSLYKAVLIPQVKYGALVLDMKGQVVGKATMDNQRMQPMIKVAKGADVTSVVALVSALVGDF